MDLTLLEVHLDDASFTANAPLSGEPVADTASGPATADDGGPPLVAFLVGLAGLAVVAYVVRRWRSGDSLDDEFEAEIQDVDAPTP